MLPQRLEAAGAATHAPDGPVDGRVAVSRLRSRLQSRAQRRDAWIVGLEAAKPGLPEHIPHHDPQAQLVAG